MGPCGQVVKKRILNANTFQVLAICCIKISHITRHPRGYEPLVSIYLNTKIKNQSICCIFPVSTLPYALNFECSINVKYLNASF